MFSWFAPFLLNKAMAATIQYTMGRLGMLREEGDNTGRYEDGCVELCVELWVADDLGLNA